MGTFDTSPPPEFVGREKMSPVGPFRQAGRAPFSTRSFKLIVYSLWGDCCAILVTRIAIQAGRWSGGRSIGIEFNDERQ